jgi:hypothetical protein
MVEFVAVLAAMAIIGGNWWVVDSESGEVNK